MAQLQSKKKDEKENADPRREAFAANLQFIHRLSYSIEDIEPLFARTDNQLCFLQGEVDFPTGRVMVADPLVYLYNPKYATPLNHTIRPGSYPVYLTAHVSAMAGLRIIAAKLKITDQTAARYEIAMPEGTTIQQLNQPGILAGFGVDAGLASFCDAQTAVEYDRFLTGWHQENPGKNHYDDYFAALFAESHRERPGLQREGGDFIQWAVPETGNRLCMFASGLGDGFYQSLWGVDAEEQICELVIPFMNPALFA